MTHGGHRNPYRPTTVSPSALVLRGTVGPTSLWYACLPVTIPGNAEYPWLDFTFNSLSTDDFLSAGINDTRRFALEDQFGTDGVADNTGLLDVSQWEGQNVSLFLGLVASDDDNAGGAITLDDFTFESVSEPGCLSLLAAACLPLLLRRKGRRRAI